jgi:hypothetical protein
VTLSKRFSVAIAIAIAACGATLLVTPDARAGEFDDRGVFAPAEDAVDFESFDEPERYLPDDTEPICLVEGYEIVKDAALALDGESFLRVLVNDSCSVNFAVSCCCLLID